MKFKLNLLPSDMECDDYESHFFGCPDLKVVWNDEAIFNNDEIFLFQINLKDLEPSFLPSTGLLSFFIATESRPFRGIVRYNDLKEDNERIDFNGDALGNYSLDQEYEMKPSKDGEIEILPDSVKFKNYHKKNNEVILAYLNLKGLSKIDLFNNYEEEVAFAIDQKDLENREFSKAYLAINLDD